jgi:gliding motility-associated-like protein
MIFRRWKHIVCTLIALVGIGLSLMAQFNITPTSSALQLARRIVGTGVNISNAQFRGPAGSAGLFTTTQPNFGIQSGIVLTTGRAQTNGGNFGVNAAANNSADNRFNAAGDPTLSNYSGRNTFDACVLEFDFIPIGDTLSVNFIFGSEEYPDFNCSRFNDVFAFMISGPNFPTETNIALVPGTTLPVAVNTINNGTVGQFGIPTGCTDLGQGAPHTRFFVDNANGNTLVYNGHTTILTAKTVVVPCQSYHIKLAIADANDDWKDSGVFIEANSFKSDGITLEPADGIYSSDSTELTLVEGCRNGKFKLTRPANVANDPAIVTLEYAGTATMGADFNTLPATVTFAPGEREKLFDITPVLDNLTEGTETLQIFLKTALCGNTRSDSLRLYIKDSIAFTRTTNLVQCSAFSNTISGRNVDTTNTNTYTWSTGATTQSITVNRPGTYTVVNNFSIRCYNIDRFVLTNGDPMVRLGNDTTLCEGDQLWLNAGVGNARYLWSRGDTLQRIQVTNGSSYWVRVTLPNGCFASDTINTNFKLLPVVDLGKDTSLCAYDSIRLGRQTYLGTSYVWSTGATSTRITGKPGNTYSLTTTLNGCSYNTSIRIDTRRMPIANAGPNQIILNGGEAKISAQRGPNNATYRWTPANTLNNANIFNPIAAPDTTTNYILRVISQDGCVLHDTMQIFIETKLSIPNAFSPNGDGINDAWNIPLLNTHIFADVQVFDRYGKLVYSTTGYDKPWNGTSNGKPLPNGVYYYNIRLNQNKSPQTGWVMIIR